MNPGRAYCPVGHGTQEKLRLSKTVSGRQSEQRDAPGSEAVPRGQSRHQVSAQAVPL